MPSKRERKSDKKRAKLEKRRRKLQNKLRKVEEQLKKYLKPSKSAHTMKRKRRAKSSAARSVLKQAKRPGQKVKPAPEKTAKALKANRAADSHASRTTRPARTRRTPNTLKRSKRPMQMVKHSAKKTARKAKRSKAVSKTLAQSASRPKRARLALSRLTAGRSEETMPAAVVVTSNTAPEMTPDVVAEAVDVGNDH
jgi:hypothetical protein